MGLGDFFRRRRERESAIPASSQAERPSEALGSFASPEGRPVVGQQIGGAGAVGSDDALAALGPMIAQAIEQGNVQIEQGEAQTIDLRGTGLREEILAIMQQHGIDAESGDAGSVDATAHGEMQQQILAALAKHVDPGAAGTSINVEIEPREE